MGLTIAANVSSSCFRRRTLAPAHRKGFAVTGTTRWHNAFRPLRAAPPDTGSSDDQPTSRLASARSDASASVERSEEHTSELQSHSDLVCRLLLEKKNK